MDFVFSVMIMVKAIVVRYFCSVGIGSLVTGLPQSLVSKVSVKPIATLAFLSGWVSVA